MLVTKLGAILFAILAMPAMCTSVQLVAPHDAALEEGLGEHRAALAQLVARLESDLDDGEAPYEDYRESYIALNAEIDTLLARARLSSPGLWAGSCALPDTIADRLRTRLGSDVVSRELNPDTGEAGNPTGCTARLLLNADAQLADFESLHYCASISQPAGGQARSRWQARCPDGPTMLNAPMLESASALLMKPVDYAWAVEIAKRPEGEGS